jgi:hypothetical protein
MTPGHQLAAMATAGLQLLTRPCWLAGLASVGSQAALPRQIRLSSTSHRAPSAVVEIKSDAEFSSFIKQLAGDLVALLLKISHMEHLPG